MTGVNYIQVYYTEVVAIVGRTVTSTAATPTITATSTKTTTLIMTVVPFDVSTTLSYYTTIFANTTVAATATTTVASSTTLTATITSTVQAACASNNIIGPRVANGKYIFGASPSNFPEVVVVDVNPGTAAYDCCAACLSTTGCQASQTTYNDNFVGCILFVDTSTTCQASYNVGGLFETGNNPGRAVYVSNGYCGQVSPEFSFD